MLAMLLFATIALQLDVGDAGCVDCAQILTDDETNLSAANSLTSPSSHNLSIAQSLYSKSSNNSDSSFPAWIKTTLGVAVVVLGLVLAGRKVISKLFIVSNSNKNHGGEKASYSKNNHRDAWKAKRAHRIHPKEIY